MNKKNQTRRGQKAASDLDELLEMWSRLGGVQKQAIFDEMDRRLGRQTGEQQPEDPPSPGQSMSSTSP